MQRPFMKTQEEASRANEILRGICCRLAGGIYEEVKREKEISRKICCRLPDGRYETRCRLRAKDSYLPNNQ